LAEQVRELRNNFNRPVPTPFAPVVSTPAAPVIFASTAVVSSSSAADVGITVEQRLHKLKAQYANTVCAGIPGLTGQARINSFHTLYSSRATHQAKAVQANAYADAAMHLYWGAPGLNRDQLFYQSYNASTAAARDVLEKALKDEGQKRGYRWRGQ